MKTGFKTVIKILKTCKIPVQFVNRYFQEYGHQDHNIKVKLATTSGTQSFKDHELSSSIIKNQICIFSSKEYKGY